MMRADWDAKEKAKLDKVVENQIYREARSSQQQIQRLDKMFGVDKGAKKERAKLAKQIKNSNPPETVKKLKGESNED